MQVQLIDVSVSPYIRRDRFTVVGVDATGDEYVYHRVFTNDRTPVDAQIQAEAIRDGVIMDGMVIDARDWSRSGFIC